MGHARTLSITLMGLEGTVVEVEADVSPGLPAFSVVGLPDSSTLQARDRVRAAAARSGIRLAQRRITVNMTPAWLPKHGSGFDLAIAIAVVDAQGDLPSRGRSEEEHTSELQSRGHLVCRLLPEKKKA